MLHFTLCMMSGAIPVEVTRLGRLRKLNLFNNKLTGESDNEKIPRRRPYRRLCVCARFCEVPRRQSCVCCTLTEPFPLVRTMQAHTHIWRKMMYIVQVSCRACSMSSITLVSAMMLSVLLFVIATFMTHTAHVVPGRSVTVQAKCIMVEW